MSPEHLAKRIVSEDEVIVITEENAVAIAASGEGVIALAPEHHPVHGTVLIWNAGLAANTTAAINYANALNLDFGAAAFSFRDDGKVWVFSFNNPSAPYGPTPRKWHADLLANTNDAVNFATANNLTWGQVHFCMRDNGQVWVFSLRQDHAVKQGDGAPGNDDSPHPNFQLRWSANLAADVPSALAFARSLNMGWCGGQVLFDERDNGEVWVFSYRGDPSTVPQDFEASLGSNVPDALQWVNSWAHAGGGAASFTMRDNGQVWAFAVTNTNPTYG